MRTHLPFPAAAGVLLLALAGCQTEAYYGAADAFGVTRQQILVKRLDETKGHLAEAKVVFTASADRFGQVRPGKETDLPRLVGDLGGAASRGRSIADDVSEDIKAVDSAAVALFDVWAKESNRYHDESLRRMDDKRQAPIKEGYAELLGKLRKAESAMKAAGDAMEDQALFMRHHPDSSGVAMVADKADSLKDKAGDVTSRTDTAIAEVNRFLETLRK